MIRLNQKYTGEISENGMPNTISLHNETLDICAPDYKRGTETTVAYSDIKQIYALKDAIVLKIMRTDVTLRGFCKEDCRDFVRFIEIGRREPLEKSKEYCKYLTALEKKEQKLELRELEKKEKRELRELEKEEKRELRELEQKEKRELREFKREIKRENTAARIAAITDTVDRLTTAREKKRQREAEIEFEKEKKLQEAEDHIGFLIVGYEDDFDSIKRKVSECYILYNKYNNYSDESYERVADKIYDVFKDNVTFLEENHPENDFTGHAKSQFNKIDEKQKTKTRSKTAEFIFCVILLIIIFICSYFFGEK